MNRIRRCQPLLGTYVGICLAGDRSVEDLHHEAGEAFAQVREAARRMSYHDPDSDLTRINREAPHRPVPVHPWVREVLSAALRLSRMTGGVFDVCVAPQLEAWGYLPDHGFASGVVADGCWRDLELTDDARVRFHRPMRIDLGGIAKGYAVDRAVAYLEGRGLAGGVVNAGGDLRVFGNAPQEIHLRHPADPQVLLRADLTRPAVATSAAYFSRRHAGGREVSPTLHPHTGEPYLGTGSVSVGAGDAMSADALTKVVQLAGSALACRVLAAYGAVAEILDDRGRRRTLP